MSVITTAWTTIRAAQNIKSPPFGASKAVKIKSIIPSPFCSPWRHPIWWWKMRQLRADIVHYDELISPELADEIRNRENKAFVIGTGDSK